MSDVLLAARLLLVCGALLILPGLLLAKALGVATAWPERIALAFSLSYSWVFLLSVIVPLFHWTADHAAVLTIVALIALSVAAARAGTGPAAAPSSTGERLGTLAVAALLVCCALAGWILEPPFTGEEGLDLASLARFADGGVITFDNTSLLFDARAFYLFQPYQLALGVIARWSGIDPLIALIKFRAFLAPLALVLIYSLLRRLTPTRADAGAAFVVVVLFVVLDMETWEWNSLFPFVRRGAVGAGVCVPALLGLCLAATREANDRNEVVTRRVALTCAPILLVASLATHPLEMFTLLCFTGGIAIAIVAGLDRAGSRRQALALMLLLAASAGAYVAIHSRAVPYVAEHERSDKESLRADLAGLAGHPLQAIAGGPTEGRPLLTRTIPATTVVVLGIPAIALAVLRAPATAAVLALGIVPLALVYATPAGFILLKLMTSVATAMDVNAYFGLLGLIAIALGATALAHALLRAAEWGRSGFRAVVATAAAGSVLLWLGWMVTKGGVAWIAGRSAAQPEFLLLVGTIVGAFVLAVAARHDRAPLAPAPFPIGVIVLAACLALPLAMPDRAFGGMFTNRAPATIVDRFRAAAASASVLDWPQYYEQLPRTFVPSVTLPRGVVDEMRKRLPPRQVVLADPRYSCGLVVLLDAYCVNPEDIYGHYFEPAAAYFRDYVREADGPAPRHPFFDDSTSLTDAERRLLDEYRVSYVLADPEHADHIAAKLDAAGVGAQLEFERDGYRLFRLNAPEARTPGR
jgi:hypothetical protein